MDVESELGIIEVGKLAGMNVVYGHPLSRISDLLNIRCTNEMGAYHPLRN